MIMINWFLVVQWNRSWKPLQDPGGRRGIYTLMSPSRDVHSVFQKIRERSSNRIPLFVAWSDDTPFAGIRSIELALDVRTQYHPLVVCCAMTSIRRD